jgi:hypothetical protein
MYTRAQSLKAWRAVNSTLGATKRTLQIPKGTHFPHPRDAGALVTTTWPVGQIADFALQLEIGAAPLLIREFDDRYEAFVAGVQLTEQILRLVQANPNAAIFVGSALLGAAVGSAITRDRSGALVGLGLGLLVASILQSKLAHDEPVRQNS